jgi:hypothetical protein
LVIKFFVWVRCDQIGALFGLIITVGHQPEGCTFIG